MRVLALDYGSARCGCALSDPTGTLATPIDAVERAATRKGMARLAQLVRGREGGGVVVGLPITLAGGESTQTREARAFADALRKRLDVPVEMYDERLTTAIAARSGGAAASEDSRAAAVMLEDWLVSRAREKRA